MTPFQPSVNASPLSSTILLPNPSVLQPSNQGGNVGLPTSTGATLGGPMLPSGVVPGKTPGKRVSSATAGGVEKKKKALKRL